MMERDVRYSSVVIGFLFAATLIAGGWLG